MKESGAASKGLFTALICILIIAALILGIIVTIDNGGGGARLIDGSGGSNSMITIQDINGEVQEIPNFKSMPVSALDKNLFTTDANGIMRYESDEATVGVSVTEWQGVIDWAAVKASGVDFALIRVGRRGYDRGQIAKDPYFEQNMDGAIAAGLDVGVYFYSKAISEKEADEEAVYVLEAIRDYKVIFPVAIYWEFTKSPVEGTIPREQSCTPEQISSYIDTFCKKISKANYKAAFYADKEMAYEVLDLDLLSKYQMWYAEEAPLPSLYYEFAIWQYTTQGTVSGISTPVRMDIGFKKY